MTHTLIAVSDRVEHYVDGVSIEEQRKPGVEGIDGYYEEDSDDPALL